MRHTHTEEEKEKEKERERERERGERERGEETEPKNGVAYSLFGTPNTYTDFTVNHWME